MGWCKLCRHAIVLPNCEAVLQAKQLHQSEVPQDMWVMPSDGDRVFSKSDSCAVPAADEVFLDAQI